LRMNSKRCCVRMRSNLMRVICGREEVCRSLRELCFVFRTCPRAHARGFMLTPSTTACLEKPWQIKG
jgi:hypothetical protein